MPLTKVLRTAQNYLPGGRDRREAVIRAVRRLGRRLHEHDFSALKVFPANQLLVDVGANYGQSAISMRMMQPSARIVCYEPNAELASKIADMFRRDRRVEVRPVGLSDVSGAFDLFVPYYRQFAYPGLASLNVEEARTWLSPETLYFFRRDHLEVRQIQCRITTLDSQNLAPYFMKIDIQGAEYDMLQGSKATLAASEPILLIESPGRDHRISRFLATFGYMEFEFAQGRFVEGPSSAMNAFFMTSSRRTELLERNPDLFLPRQPSRAQQAS